jgi:hypothetical protein
MWTLLALAALTFPDIQARDLDGKAVAGHDLEGRPTAVLLGFSYGSRTQVEAWTRALVDATRGALPVVVMPVYPAGMPGPVRGWVDGQMASRTEPALRRHAWTTTDHDALVRGLGLGPGADTVAVLLDAKRHVVDLEQGAPTGARTAAFLKAWDRVKGGRP